MSLVFPHGPRVTAPVAGGGEVPIERIFCVGRNYAAHAREMGRDPDREPPFFFTKWASAITGTDVEIAYPPQTENYHYEVELCLVIGKAGADIPVAEARNHVFGYCVGLDMTRRDLQLAAREQGRPWDTGKNFDESAPLGLVHKVEDVGHPESGSIRLSVNGEVKQDADLEELIWPVVDVVSILSGLYALRPGDLVMTGTPAGVGPVVRGDRLTGEIAGLSPVEVSIGAVKSPV